MEGRRRAPEPKGVTVMSEVAATARRTPSSRATAPDGRLARLARGFALLGACALAAAAARPAAAQSVGTVRPVAWANLAQEPPANSGIGRLITVRPANSPAVIAAQLRAQPAGARGLLLIGFADDIASKDTVVGNYGNRRYVLPSPWIPRGIDTVHARMNTFMWRLYAANASVDFVVVRSTASLGASRIAAYGANAWKVIEADPRFAPVKAEIGSVNLAAEMTAGSPVRAKWDAYFTRELDQALSQTVAASVTRYFPGATVVGEGRYSRATASPFNGARKGGAFGTNEQPQLVAASATMQPFEALSALIGEARALRAETGRRLAPSVPSPSWAGLAGKPSVLRNTGFWEEVAFHLALEGSPGAIIDRGGITNGDRAALAAIAAQVQARTGGASASPVGITSVVDTDAFFASAATVGGQVLWRVSFAPGVNTAYVTFTDNSTLELPRAAGWRGAWFQHAPGVGVASILASPGVSGPPTFAFLWDDSPTPAFVNPVPYAVKYLAVYQDDVDPSIKTTGVINPAAVVAEVARLRALGWNSEWGMLDFEEPFDAVLSHGQLNHPLYETVMTSLVDTIRAVKAAFPDMKWTYYGMPRIHYWVYGVGGQDWDSVSESTRTAAYEFYLAPYAPLMSELDWVMPSLYDLHSRALNAPAGAASGALAAERSWRRANVEAVRHHYESTLQPIPPIIPVVSPWFQPGGTAPVIGAIPLDEFMEEQVEPCIEAGANGIAIWGAMAYYLTLATFPDLPPSYAGLTAVCRHLFAQQYLGGVNPNSVDWFDPAIYTLIGGAMNEHLTECMLAIDAARDTAGLAPHP
jgi:hypothetical protein